MSNDTNTGRGDDILKLFNEWTESNNCSCKCKLGGLDNSFGTKESVISTMRFIEITIRCGFCNGILYHKRIAHELSFNTEHPTR
jgi:hypothetical protein